MVSLSNHEVGHADPATPPFSLEQLVTAPIGRVDAFGVGVDPAAQSEAEAEE